MRLRLSFVLPILVLAETIALASPSPVLPEAQAAVRGALGELVVDAAIVWSAFVLAAVLITGLLATARLRRGGRRTLLSVRSSLSYRRVMPAAGQAGRAAARP